MLLKQGRASDARAAFGRYLQLAPNAPDAPLVRQMMTG
jgi:cytochrome c-type biogenesis protein CcmH/NrfG